MQEKYEHFRRQAQDCIEAASHVRDLGMKADWLQLAAKWLEMVPPDATSDEQHYEELAERRGMGLRDSRSPH